ncbi:MAG: RNA-binding S4 domain-containing protein [Desulfopila sp.]|nr:RNA-binding S4 domain-containing protein [Desulfopila sp.]
MSAKVTFISSYPIRLGQFLKLVNAVQDGLEAKIWLHDGLVRVNGEIEIRRGRKLHKNDIVELVDGTKYVLQ